MEHLIVVKIRDILEIEAIKICKEDFWPWPFIISYLIFLRLRRNCNLVGQFKCSRILFDGTWTYMHVLCTDDQKGEWGPQSTQENECLERPRPWRKSSDGLLTTNAIIYSRRKYNDRNMSCIPTIKFSIWACWCSCIIESEKVKLQLEKYVALVVDTTRNLQTYMRCSKEGNKAGWK